jgi:[citrate (pro-3S)-lyase] ligase
LYVFGGSQLIDLMNTPAFKEKFLTLAKDKGFNVNLNVTLDRGLFAYFNDILSLSLIPGDRVFFTLCSHHLSYIPNRQNIPAVIIWLSKYLEKKGVKLFIYLFPILTNKSLTPYEKILPRHFGHGIKGADEEFYKNFNNKWEEFVAEQRNNFAANGVRLFYNCSLNKSEKLCFLNISHYTKTGNAILSEEILGLFENSDFLDENYSDKLRTTVKFMQLYNQVVNIYKNFKGIKEYCEDLAKYKKDGKSGAIVMNCNPVTNGHMYLIKTAAEQVDNLFIFVVEEDKSEFPFDERIELVRENCKDIENVTVLPSGKFIISQLTFPEYFQKAGKTELDPSGKPSVINDVTAFAVKISPALGIKIRFAGEEPLDPITREYNRVMANLLPFYGVEFVEIKRKEEDGEVISASRVRKLLHENNFEAIKPLVPEATYKYLTKRQQNK